MAYVGRGLDENPSGLGEPCVEMRPVWGGRVRMGDALDGERAACGQCCTGAGEG